MYFDVRNQLVYNLRFNNVSQRATFLLSKLYAWIDELDGRGMLSVNEFTFPTEKTGILLPSESETPEDLKFKKKTISSIQEQQT